MEILSKYNLKVESVLVVYLHYLNVSYNVQTREFHKFTRGKDLFHLVAFIGAISGGVLVFTPP